MTGLSHQASQVPLPGHAFGHDVVAEHLVDLDHVRVGRRVPRVERPKLRLLLAEPAQHRDLQEQAEAVAPVRAQHAGVELPAVTWLLALARDHGVAGEDARATLSGDQTVDPPAAGQLGCLERSDALGAEYLA